MVVLEMMDIFAPVLALRFLGVEEVLAVAQEPPQLITIITETALAVLYALFGRVAHQL